MARAWGTGCLWAAAVLLPCGLGAQEVAPGVAQVPAAVATAGQTAASSGFAEPAGSSQIRIVRLSQARGVVQMDRAMGRGFEAAILNMPVVHGARLRTGQGVAEVEFEDNSSLRLTPESEVRFAQLSRLPDGHTLTTVQAVKGTVYVSLEGTKGNQFALSDGAARVLLLPGTRMRLDASRPDTELAVLRGSSALQVGGTDTVLKKGQFLTFNPAGSTVSMVSGGAQQEPWDDWDKQEADYHNVKANRAYGFNGGGGYGTADMGYYGSFADLPGCGSVWRPYFASSAWSPYDNGSWAMYQGGGYSWVSPYPWGWLPYHTGSWVSCGGAGWGWRPGGQFYGLNNGMAMNGGGGGVGPGMVNAPRLPGRSLPYPVPPAGAGGQLTRSLIPVMSRPMPVSGMAGNGQSFVFRRDSAGMGVPRGSFGDLHGVAGHVEQKGMMMRSLNTGGMSAEGGARAVPGGIVQPGVPNAQGGMRPGFNGAPPTAMHRNSGMGEAPGGMGGGRSGPAMAPAAGGGMSRGASPAAASHK